MKTSARLLYGLVILTLVVTSCTRPRPLATPGAAPSALPTATAMPLPPVAPTVVAVRPQRNEEHPPTEPIVVTFDQPMDPEETARAVTISPPVEGEVEVRQNQVVFRPARPLALAARYELTISEQARSERGLPMLSPYVVRFTTVGLLEVTSTQPANGAEDVAVDGALTVVFNRPVVPLVSSEQQGDLPNPLRIEPEVEGTGVWLNTSVYQFTPDPAFAGATDYIVTVAAGLTDTTGSALQEDFVLTFRTADPTVTDMQPQGAQIPPTTAITVTFSQPMEAVSAEAAFSLTPAAPGTFRWSDDGRTLTFVPSAPLAFGTRYTVQVADTARPATGQGGLRRGEQWRLQTVFLPEVTRTEPADGDQQADPYSGVDIFFASPIDPGTIGEDAITILPKPTDVYTFYSFYENRLYIGFEKEPSTHYTVTLAATVGDVYGNTLGQPVTVRFRTRDYDPAIQLGQTQQVGTYNAYTETVLPIFHRNVSRLDVSLYRVDETRFIQLLGDNGWQYWENFQPDEANLVQRVEMPVSTPRNETALASVPLDDGGDVGLPPGLYYVSAIAPELRQLSASGKGIPNSVALLVVSKLNVTFKHSMTDMLVWATDLQSGQPVGDVPVRVETESGTLVQGRTDADGVFRADFDAQEVWRVMYAFVGEGDSYGVALNRWTEGIGPWEFNIASELYRVPYNGVVYTERPIYRPGQTVYWKAIVRTDDDARYTIPRFTEPLRVEIWNPEGRAVLSQPMTPSEFGTLSGEFTLESEASLGYYSINIGIPGQDFGFGSSFQVAEYRVPEFELSIVSDRPEYIQGDVMTFTVDASYFFGGPVKDAAVAWTLATDDYYFYWEPPDTTAERRFYDFNPDVPTTYFGFGEAVAQGRGTTDGEGRFVLELPATIGDKLRSQRLTLNIGITDLNNQEVAGSASVVVHKGEFYPGLSPDFYIGTAGEEQSVRIVTVDTQGNLVPGITLTVVAATREWFSVQEQADNGFFYWVSKPQDTPFITETVTTDANGMAVFRYTPETGGLVAVTATGTDRRGNTVSATTSVWVASGRGQYVYWQRENNDRINLVADRKEYRVGDTAQILIPSPYQGEVTALLTIERGTVLSHELITLNSNSETISVPILADYAPNVFVSLVLVKGVDETNPDPSFKLGYVALPVSTEQQELTITLEPSSGLLAPRQTVTYTVTATDYMGQPVDAEISLALVDKAIFTLSQSGQTSLVEQFYRQRGVGLQTATTLSISINRLNQNLAESGKGGGGGGGMDESGFVRQEFPDTAFWQAAVRTGDDGEAEVSLTLPDNLTTWRMTARALTADTLVGDAQTDVVSTLDLLVRPVAPRFFVAGDKAELAAVVHNNTASPLTAVVDLQAAGATLTSTTVLTISVPAHGTYKATWPAEVNADADRVTLQYSVRGGQLADAVRLTLPVYHYAVPDTVATAGEVTAAEPQRLELIALPPEVDTTQGDLRVRVEPSLAAGMRAGLEALTYTEYDSTETVLSRFLPNIVTYQAVQDVGGALQQQLAAALPSLVSDGVQRLYRLQLPDGGWGWWGTDDVSNPFLTAYVVFGLAKAQQADFLVDEQVMQRALAYLTRQLQAPADFKANYEANMQAFILYALAEAGQEELGRAVALFDYRERLGHYGKAFLALALGLLEPDEPSRVDTLLDDLTGSAVVSATGTHWEEAWVDYFTMNTDIRTTAIVVSALATLRPDDAVLPGAVRWLMAAREGGGFWPTSQETAWSIIGLTRWTVASGELQGDYDWRVSLNGQTLAQESANAANLDEPVEMTAVVAGLSRAQANALLLERLTGSDAGRMYYTAHLRLYRPVDAVEPISRGIFVQREYALADAPDEPITAAKVGDIIQVKLTIVAPTDLTYVRVEDPIPAGTEAVDVSLATTRQDLSGPELEREKAPPDGNYWWNRWVPSYTQMRDEKVALFADYLPRGTYEYTYQLRASLPGEYQVIPTSAEEMYFPEVFGRSGGMVFTVTE